MNQVILLTHVTTKYDFSTTNAHSSDCDVPGVLDCSKHDELMCHHERRGRDDEIESPKPYPEGTYGVYAILCFAGYVFVDNLVFETKGLALQDIEGVMAEREKAEHRPLFYSQQSCLSNDSSVSR